MAALVQSQLYIRTKDTNLKNYVFLHRKKVFSKLKLKVLFYKCFKNVTLPKTCEPPESSQCDYEDTDQL